MLPPDRLRCCCLAIAGATLLTAGCATTPDTGKGTPAAPTDAYRSVLSQPERLRAVGADGFAREWVDPAADFRKYDQVLIERIRVKLDADSSDVDPTDLKALTDYFHSALVKALEPQYPVVAKSGPNVLRLRITLVDLVSTKPEMSVIVLVTPYATVPDMLVSAASGGPTGSAPYLGRTGIAVEFIDGGSRTVVAQFADTSFGRKFVLDKDGDLSKTVSGTVDGYAKSFSTWAYAQQAFDEWAQLFRQRLDAANGRKPG